MQFALFLVPAALLSCTSSSSGGAEQVQLGVIRVVDAEKLGDPDEWGPDLDLALVACD